MYDEKHQLTRAGAEEVIRSGGTVLLGGKMYRKVEELPDQTTFARGNPEAEKAAIANIDAQIAALATQRASLTAPKPAAQAPPTQESDGLDDMTVADLKEEAESRGVEVPSGAHKQDIIDLLRAKK